VGRKTLTQSILIHRLIPAAWDTAPCALSVLHQYRVVIYQKVLNKYREF